MDRHFILAQVTAFVVLAVAVWVAARYWNLVAATIWGSLAAAALVLRIWVVTADVKGSERVKVRIVFLVMAGVVFLVFGITKWVER